LDFTASENVKIITNIEKTIAKLIQIRIKIWSMNHIFLYKENPAIQAKNIKLNQKTENKLIDLTIPLYWVVLLFKI